MGDWLHEEFVQSGKLPLTLCFVAFIVAFAITRIATRMIRAGKGPFRDNVTPDGVHVHHAVYGIGSLMVGAVVALGATSTFWRSVAGILVGAGMSLVLDEFALILHLKDVYWSREGRLSVDVISLTAAVLLLALIGATPLGIGEASNGEVYTRLGTTLVVVLHGSLLAICLAKGKYGVSLFGLFVPVISTIGSIRLARPRSAWARHFYSEAKLERATGRSTAFDARWGSRWNWWTNFVGGFSSDEPADQHEVGRSESLDGRAR